MRIAFVCADPGVPVFGLKGASRHVREVIRAMRRQGALVELFATNLKGDPPPDLADLPVHLLPVPEGETAVREQAAMAANDELGRALARMEPFDFVYERYSLWSHEAMAYAQSRGVPGLLEVNAPLIEEQAQYRILVDRAAASQIARRVFRASTALLAVSEGVASYLESFPEAKGRVHIVPNGVDPRRFKPGLAPAWEAEPDTFTVGFSGSMKPWHGLDVLVEAFALLHQEFPATRLLMVGEGPARDKVETNVRARNLTDLVHFAGPVPPDDVPYWLASMQVAVAPYPDLEQFYFSPLKIYEYMAAGLPVVTSRVGQLPRLVQENETGLLYPPGDARVLANKLGQIYCDPELRVQLGRGGREIIERRHSWDAVIRRIFILASHIEQPA